MFRHEKAPRRPLRFCHSGDFHLDEDRYFADTAQCLEWFVEDAVRASVALFVINGDLTTYKANLQHAAGRGHSLRNSVLGRNGGSPGWRQRRGVRAHAASGYGPWAIEGRLESLTGRTRVTFLKGHLGAFSDPCQMPT